MKGKFLLSIFFILFCTQKNIHIKNARNFIAQWNYERALIELLKYREEKDSEIQYLLGMCYFGKNEYEQAKEHFRISLSIDTVFRDSILNIYTNSAKKVLKISDFQKALQLYKTLVDLIPDYKQADNLFLVAELNFQQGNYSDALLGYTKAYQIDSTSEMARKSVRNFLRTLIECDSLDLAHVIAKREYERARTSENLLLLGEINFRLGMKYYENKVYDSATVFLKEVVANEEPKSLLDDACFYLGEIFYVIENYNQAIEYYKKVIRLNPYQKGELVQKSQARIKEIKEK